MVNDLAKLHDDALDFEGEIFSDADLINEIRLKMWTERDPERLREVIPALNAMIEDAERYKEWLKTALSN
ncbi:MAG: hypothetical protein ACRC3H_13210 [Lachnospiraceae bacterium]